MRKRTPRRRRNPDGLLLPESGIAEVPPHLSCIDIKDKHEISIVLVGCGGTGSQILTGLGQIHASLQALHHSHGLRCQGLRVTVYDPDTVSPFNVGRQLFYTADIGRNKADCLVGRVNMAYGTRWAARGAKFGDGESGSVSYQELQHDILITCVDTAEARRRVHEMLFDSGNRHTVSYWLDCGNLATVGQVVLGQPPSSETTGWPWKAVYDPELILWQGQRRKQSLDALGTYHTMVFEKAHDIRLPCVTELFPELLDEGFEETNEPSCSMVDALAKQSLFVNRTVSSYALDLLWELIKEGKIENQGCFFNLRTRTAQPIPLKVWPIH